MEREAGGLMLWEQIPKHSGAEKAISPGGSSLAISPRSSQNKPFQTQVNSSQGIRARARGLPAASEPPPESHQLF